MDDPRPALSCPITPVMVFLLMTGSYAEMRLKGWVAAVQRDPAPDVAWAAHRERLVAEAAAHGFEPFWATRKQPSGVRFEEWKASFFAMYGY